MGKEKKEKKASTIAPTSLTPDPSTASPPTPLRMERGVECTVCRGFVGGLQEDFIGNWIEVR